MKMKVVSLALINTVMLSGMTVWAQQANPGALVPDHYIVELRPGAVPEAVAARHGLSPNFVYDTAINGFAGMVPPGLLRRLLADAEVTQIVPDREVFAFKTAGGSTTIPRQQQVLPAGVFRIGAPDAWQTLNSANFAQVGVAVVDTGLDSSHPDLNVSRTYYSAIRGTNGKDDNGHGTHVGGIIAAKNDGYDVVGVAPSATLYSIKVLNRTGSGAESGIIAGLNWIAQNYNKVTPNIRVVNMSLGRPGSIGDDPPYQAAIAGLNKLGITVVVAAGNDSTVEISSMVPACYPEVIAVASTTALKGASSWPGFSGILADTASFFTTDGPGVAISAPGEDEEDVNNAGTITSLGILSTRLGGGTTRMSGTSMASPHVAGVAALIYAKLTGVTADTPKFIRAQITATAEGATTVPYASPTSSYTFDGKYEGVVSAVNALK